MTTLPVAGKTTGRTGATSPVLLGLARPGRVRRAARGAAADRRASPAEYFPPTSRIAGALWRAVGPPGFWVAFGQTPCAPGPRAGHRGRGRVSCSALVIGAVPLLRALTASTIEFLRPIPSVALIPLVVRAARHRAWRSTLVLVVYASFWQVLVQVLYGVADVDPVAAGHRPLVPARPAGRRVRYLIWPTALPYAMTGFRLAASVALILTITGEFVIGAPGLGSEIDGRLQQRRGRRRCTPWSWSPGCSAWPRTSAPARSERRVLAWHPSVRKEVPV